MSEESKPFAFTMARLERLAPPGTRTTYHDTELPGLALRVAPSGHKSFIVFAKLRGSKRRVRVTLGRFPTMSVESARKAARPNLDKLAGGIDPNSEKKAKRSERTLGDLFADYLENHAKPRKRTWEEDQRRFAFHLSSWAGRQISAIAPSDVQTWHARVGRDNGPFAANRAHALLRKMFNFARLRGWKGENPAVGVSRFRERTRERFMDAEELRQFFTALQAESDRTARDFFLLALLTGARRANVLGMRWSDIDLQRGLWRIPEEKSKSGEPLVVILAPQVVALLSERYSMAEERLELSRARDRSAPASPWVLPSASSKTGHYVEPKCAWMRILARAELARLVDMIASHRGLTPEVAMEMQKEAEEEVGRIRFHALARRSGKGTDPHEVVMERKRVEARDIGLDPDRAKMRDLRIHDLRRTLGSWQAAAGASLSIIGRSLGHRQVQTTAIYARLSLDPVRESVEKATTAILAVVEQSGGPKFGGQ